jgi:hypothetical protein
MVFELLVRDTIFVIGKKLGRVDSCMNKNYINYALVSKSFQIVCDGILSTATFFVKDNMPNIIKRRVQTLRITDDPIKYDDFVSVKKLTIYNSIYYRQLNIFFPINNLHTLNIDGNIRINGGVIPPVKTLKFHCISLSNLTMIPVEVKNLTFDTVINLNFDLVPPTIKKLSLISMQGNINVKNLPPTMKLLCIKYCDGIAGILESKIKILSIVRTNWKKLNSISALAIVDTFSLCMMNGPGHIIIPNQTRKFIIDARSYVNFTFDYTSEIEIMHITYAPTGYGATIPINILTLHTLIVDTNAIVKFPKEMPNLISLQTYRIPNLRRCPNLKKLILNYGIKFMPGTLFPKHLEQLVLMNSKNKRFIFSPEKYNINYYMIQNDTWNAFDSLHRIVTEPEKARKYVPYKKNSRRALV